MVAFNVGWNSRISLAILTLSASAAATVYLVIKRTKRSCQSRIRELEESLSSAIDKCSAERQGRIRAQQELRKAIIAQPPSSHNKLQVLSYPMTPIGVVRSCFSTRNGTPRQPLLVPLARACLKFDSSRVPPASLEGLEEYSHCWIVYVFHLNTNLEKLWKDPARSKFKAKVRVPRLKGERVGVFATRTPHRPCPIGLTVAKVEAVKGNMVVLSGVDLVDGTPVLDIKPYLPYCDSVHEATVPNWVKGDNLLAIATVKFSKDFASKLAECWAIKGNKSLYTSADELQELIREVLSWDIRSVSQRQKQHPHPQVEQKTNSKPLLLVEEEEEEEEEAVVMEDNEEDDDDDGDDSVKDAVIYHLVLEELDVSYKIDKGHVFVDGVMPYQPSNGAAQ